MTVETVETVDTLEETLEDLGLAEPEAEPVDIKLFPDPVTKKELENLRNVMSYEAHCLHRGNQRVVKGDSEDSWARVIELVNELIKEHF